MIKVSNTKIIDCHDWDKLVVETYGRPYCFQQQDECQSRGLFELSIPSDFTMNDEMNDSIPEKVNGEEMGVKFDVWLARDPKQPIPNQTADYQLRSCAFYFYYQSPLAPPPPESPPPKSKLDKSLFEEFEELLESSEDESKNELTIGTTTSTILSVML